MIQKTEEHFVLLLKEGIRNGMLLMGNVVSGYKFTGGGYDRTLFWNNLLKEYKPPELQMNADFFKKNDLSALDYSPEIWW